MAALIEIAEKLDSIIKQFPDRKQEILDAIGSESLETLQRNIRQFVNDENGFITSAQEYVIGSRRSYVAIRPIYRPARYQEKSANWKNRGRYSAKVITNYLEYGHPVRKATVRGYKSRAHTAYVAPRAFYGVTQKAVPTILEHAARRWEERIANDLR